LFEKGTHADMQRSQGILSHKFHGR